MQLSWQVTENLRVFDGYAQGCRSPSIKLTLRSSSLSLETRNSLNQAFYVICSNYSPPDESSVVINMEPSQSLAWLLSVWQRLQLAYGLPVFETGKVLTFSEHHAQCLIPVVPNGHRVMAQVLKVTLQWLQRQEDSAWMASKDCFKALEQGLRGLKLLAPNGSNVHRFVQAAYDLHMPTVSIPGGVLQFGQGSCLRWLDSSFTDQTPVIAAKLSRNKRLSNALLNMVGIPVPPHVMVANVEVAVAAAERLCYPVVVKPADLDGGSGVSAYLQNAQEVREAFELASTFSKNVLVEKHVFGKDYRLTVFQGELIWAIERVRAGVVGDGQHSVLELVELVNVDPRRGEGAHAPLKRLQIDAIALGFLQKQGVTATSVPALGQSIYLRSVANISTGGKPVAVFHEVHPDNARLAVRAAQALGLDLAGIDLLIPDVAKSWLENGNTASICEVNGQPQLGQTTGAHLYKPILKTLVRGNGRVPIILVLGANEPKDWLSAFGAAFQTRGLCVGTADQQGVFVAGELLTPHTKQLFAAGIMLALNRDVDAMVLAITESSLLTTGLPWARFDALVVAGKAFQYDENFWLQHLLPACDGVVMTRRVHDLIGSETENGMRLRLLELGSDINKMAVLVTQAVIESSQHRAIKLNAD